MEVQQEQPEKSGRPQTPPPDSVIPNPDQEDLPLSPLSPTREQEQICLIACAPSDAHLSEMDDELDEDFGCRHRHQYPYSSGSSPVTSFRMAVHQSRAHSQCGKFNESLLGGLTDSARIKASLCVCTSIRHKTDTCPELIVEGEEKENEAAEEEVRKALEPEHFPTKTRSIMDEYKISHEIIGIGESGKVMACYNRHTGEKFALKVLRDSARSRREIELHWLACRQPNVVSILDIFENTFDGLNCLLVVVEFMQGGDLLTLFEAGGRVPYSEQCVARIVWQIGCAVQFLHEQNIAHRDVKLENILCSSPNVDTCTFKLADFGFAKRSDPDRKLNSPCCTPAYVCPEILNYKEYDKGCDIWALGVATYILLCGYPPFYSMQGLPFSPGMRSRITTGLFAFPAEDWDGVSASTKHMIRLMLRTEPSERINIQQLMSSEFLSAASPATSSVSANSLPPVPSDSSISSDAGFESTDSTKDCCDHHHSREEQHKGRKAEFFLGAGTKSKSARQLGRSQVPNGRPPFAALLRDRVYSIQEQVDSALAFMRLGGGGSGGGFCVLKNPSTGPTGSRLLERRRSSAAAAAAAKQQQQQERSASPCGEDGAENMAPM